MLTQTTLLSCPVLYHPSRLRLLLVHLPPTSNPLQDALPILVQLKLRDLTLGGRDADGHALAVALLARDALDVDDVLEAVDGGDLALAALVAAALDDDFVVFAEGNRADLLGVSVRGAEGGWWMSVRCAFL